MTIGECIRDLELLAGASTPEDWVSRVVYLPI